MFSAWDWLWQSFVCGVAIFVFIALPYIFHWGDQS